MVAWVSRQQARAEWPDAPLDDTVLDRLLDDATTTCAAYAPALPTGTPPPGSYARATVLQARELWAAARRDGDLIGTGADYQVRARPLTGAVRQLLRPRAGVPRIR